jgi:hypothetical protein
MAQWSISRKALCIGLNYSGTDHALGGCIDDANRMKVFLEGRGFNVSTLTDRDSPVTAKSVVEQLERLVEVVNNNRRDTKVVIHYSGHGSYVRDTSGDEPDNRDEVIVASDYCVSDDFLHSIIAKFKPGTRVFCLFDCCHSGTILDLRYRSGILENRRCTVKNEVCAISGCKDDQTSSDLSFADGTHGGAMTMAFLCRYANHNHFF